MVTGRGLAERYAAFIVDHHRSVVVVLVLATVLVGGGVALLDGGVQMAQFEVDSTERDAMEYVDSNFQDTDHEVTLIVVRGDDVLAHESVLKTMALQRALRANETVAGTLADDRSTIGVGNVVALSADQSLTEDGVTIDDEIGVVANHSQTEFDAELREAVLTGDRIPGDRPPVTSLLPAGFDPDDGSADARLVLVVHDENVAEEDLLEAQRAIDGLVNERLDGSGAYVFGEQLTFDRGAEATAGSFALVGPIVVVLVGGVLLVAYRDPLDVLLGMVGILLVLVWMAGFLGWTGIGFNQLLVAVPCLLVGLSIDHGLHVAMRHREARRSGVSVGRAMRVALAGVIVAIGATTVTTMVGFLTGLASPIGVLRQFGVVAAFGILAAFVVFGALVPALKLELEQLRPRRGSDHSRESIGSIRPIARTMGATSTVATSAPITVVAVALLLALGGAYGVAGVDTSTERTDFLPGESPSWMAHLPEAVHPGDHSLREEAIFLEETFDRSEGQSVSILLDGDPTDPATLEAVQASERTALEATTLGTRHDGRPVIYSPLVVLESLARADEGVAKALDEADTNGDGVPDDDLAAVYDAAFEADPVRTGEVIHRGDDGTYEAVRLVVTVDGDAAGPVVRWEMNEVAASASATTDRPATATGEPILAAYQDRAVAVTAFATFVAAIVVITVLLTVAFRVRHGSWALGPITVAPVVAALAWVVGVMWALSIPYNAETAIITGIAIGIGVDYTIHVTERFLQERRHRPVQAALETATVETGGALLASAVTTGLGFAVLVLTAVPSLQRFGLITALFVTFAFLASVLVLPAMLTIWTGWVDRTDRPPADRGG